MSTRMTTSTYRIHRCFGPWRIENRPPSICCLRPVNSGTKSGDALLWEAVRKGKTVFVKLLLETGKFNTALKDDTGRRLLWRAVESGKLALVKLLLEVGNFSAYIHIPNENGWTSFNLAKANNYTEIIALLKSYDE